MKFTSYLRLGALSSILAVSSPALTIVFDYSHDLAGSNFFGANPTAKTALEQAGADLSAFITSTLNAILLADSQGITGTVGASTATFDWHLTYTNPATGATVTLNDFSSAADTVTIYVGARNLSGSTLGQGGPGGAGYSFSGSAFEADWVATVAAAETASNNIMTRGGMIPINGSISGNSTIGSTTANFTVNYSPIIGNLWFDMDTDNDGFADNSTTLNSFWHFDHTTAVDPLKYDFYSVALHEILHALGYGTALSWDNLVDGTTWLGTHGIAEHGTGAGLIDAGGAHITASIGSTTFYGGVAQEAVMDPDISPGVRKIMTDLDVAILQDIGYSAVPEPGSFALLLGALSLAGMATRRRRRA